MAEWFRELALTMLEAAAAKIEDRGREIMQEQMEALFPGYAAIEEPSKPRKTARKSRKTSSKSPRKSRVKSQQSTPHPAPQPPRNQRQSTSTPQPIHIAPGLDYFPPAKK
jgi:hypothetical protein